MAEQLSKHNASEDEMFLSSVREKAKEFITKMETYTSMAPDWMMPNDLGAAVYALEQVREFVIEIGLLTEEEVEELKEPRIKVPIEVDVKIKKP